MIRSRDLLRAIAWAIGLGSIAGPLPGCARPHPPDILLATIDTLRADHVSASGHPASPATPAFDRVASEGVLFEQAVAPAPLTLPSHASILTGQWPFRHGVRDNGGFRLPPGIPTLAEVLRSRGYATAAFVGAFVLDSRFGLDRGFQTYDDAMPARPGEPVAYLGESRRDGAAVAAAAASWIAAAGPAPIFVWVHLYDPHAPYEAAAGFRERYPQRPYAAAVAQADAALGAVLDALDRRPGSGSAVVAIAGDHGEGLGEHGEATHGVFVYDGTMRVPLALRSPAVPRGARIGWQARLIDLAPTLLSLAGNGRPGGRAGARSEEALPGALQADGTDLVPALTGAAPSPDLPGYAESFFGTYHYGWSPLRALRQGGLKWIEAPRPELYDLARDPDESDNLLDRDPDGARRIAARLEEIAGGAGSPPPAPGREGAETLARLRALGYVGGDPSSAPAAGPRGAGAPLPDPKDGIHRHSRFEEVFRGAAGAFDAGDDAEAWRRATALLREFPEARDARRLRALAALNLGRDAEARRDLEGLLRQDLSDVEARAALGHALERAGERGAALEQVLKALDSGPERPDLLLRAGRLLRLEGRLAEADRLLDRAAAQDPASGSVLFERGLVRLAGGGKEEAENLFRRALAADPGPRGAHHNLALLLEERGDEAGARREYEAEVAVHPEAASSHLNLGLLLQRLGETEAARQHLEAAARASPSDPRALTALAAALLREPGGKARARSLLREALRLDPGNAPARTLLRETGS